MAEKKRSCRLCSYFEVCSWVSEPYMDCFSGGYKPRTSYEQFHKEYYEAFGNNCSRYKDK